MKYFFPEPTDKTFVISTTFKAEIQFCRYGAELKDAYEILSDKNIPLQGVLIEHITVPVEWRQRRIGTRLLNKAIRWSIIEFGDGVRFILQLMTPTDRTNLPMEVLQGWYEKHGFRRVKGTEFMIL